jgi:hypothetical protein
MGISNRAHGFGRTISSESITGVGTATAVGFTVPAGTKSAVVTNGAQAARYRVDGNDPTTAVGHFIAANGNVEVFGLDDVSRVKFISTSATTNLFVTYYGE